MPYEMVKNKDGSYKVVSPHGTKAAKTSKKNATRQIALLNAIEQGGLKEKKTCSTCAG